MLTGPSFPGLHLICGGCLFSARTGPPLRFFAPNFAEDFAGILGHKSRICIFRPTLLLVLRTRSRLVTLHSESDNVEGDRFGAALIGRPRPVGARASVSTENQGAPPLRSLQMSVHPVVHAHDPTPRRRRGGGWRTERPSPRTCAALCSRSYRQLRYMSGHPALCNAARPNRPIGIRYQGRSAPFSPGPPATP